ncbi:target of Myb1 membrane trafficking protein isoform X1 [Ambystoma mexicanum]|uniref:target of Myb1 membrane trafficking protein isoform X1 n=1 Tax=Ambystoma mexicanum TaxID=8296 RepID=UPI0037E988AC
MDFLLGNPYASPVGQRIEKATEGALQAEDWALNMEICDIINETEEGPKDAIRALKKRIGGNKNFHEVLLALTVLETCVKNCGHRFHSLVASQDFVENVMVRIILPKNNPPTVVQDKVLMLIQSWADAFRSSPGLTGVVSVYEDLRRKGLEFPMTDLDTLSPIHTPQRSVQTASAPDAPTFAAGDPPQRVPSVTGPAVPPMGLPPAAAADGDAAFSPSPEQIGKIRSELEVVNGNVKVMSEMLAELVPGQASPSDLELLQELNRTCHAMQQRILELIPRVLNEQLTEELLLVNDNLNNVFLRHERFERIHAGQSATALPTLVPQVIQGEASLVDLSPAISPVCRLEASSLSTQLATMHLDSPSMSGTLQTLEAPPRAPDDFDMFAMTRGSSLAEQRKSVKYEEPQAADGLAGALDTRQQNTGAMEPELPQRSGDLSHWMSTQGMIPVTQACMMDDIEKWLSVDVDEEAEDAEGVTSEEFDKFLESRAKAADQLPILPSPPSEPPGPALNTSRSKREKEEDSLFAL